MMTTYQVDYLVPEELNGAHVAERKLGKLSCRPTSLTCYEKHMQMYSLI